MLSALVFAVIVFLNAGEVWSVPLEGGAPSRLTRTGALVEDFRISRDGAYLAYAKRIRRAEERPVTSIVIVRVATGAVLAEIKPAEGWIDLDGWIGTTLVYHASAAMEVTGFFEYDAAHNRRRALDMTAGALPMERDVAVDREVRVFVDDSGLGPTYRQRLHVVTGTGSDEIDALHRSVMSPALSPDSRTVAFVEVVDSAHGKGARLPSLDRVWLHRTGGGDVMIHERPVQGKSGGSGLSWAPDGSRLSMNYGGTTYLLDPGHPGAAPRDIRGHDACWGSTHQLVVTTPGGSIAVVDVVTGAQRIVAQRGTTSQCVITSTALRLDPRGGRVRRTTARSPVSDSPTA